MSHICEDRFWGSCDGCMEEARAELAALREERDSWKMRWESSQEALTEALAGALERHEEAKAAEAREAALREELDSTCGALTAANEEGIKDRRELEQARALLAEVTFWLEEAWGKDVDDNLVVSSKVEALGAVAWDAIENARAAIAAHEERVRSGGAK